jgi:hypothetical protein
VDGNATDLDRGRADGDQQAVLPAQGLAGDGGADWGGIAVLKNQRLVCRQKSLMVSHFKTRLGSDSAAAQLTEHRLPACTQFGVPR